MGALTVFGGKKKNNDSDTGIHYRRMGTIITISKFLTLLLLLLVVLWGFSFHTDQINMDNFKYLVNSLTGDNIQVDKYKTIYYDSNEHNKFTLVRGDLAVVNGSGCTVYGLNGQRKAADSSVKMDNPQVVTGSKYMYIYDLGGNELVIKNALETVKTLRYNYAIRDVAATDDGYIAVASSEKTTRSTVFVYDEKYREVYKRSFGSQYTQTIDLSGDESKLLTASVYANNGVFITELGLYSLKQEDAIATLQFKEEYPYKAVFTENGGFMLMTDKCCRFFDGEGKLISTAEFGLTGIDSYGINGEGFMRMYSSATMSAEETIELYDGKSGKLLLTESYEKGIRLARYFDGHLFVVSDGTLCITRIEDGEKAYYEVSIDVIEILPIENTTVFVLTHGTGGDLDYGKLFNANAEVSE